MASYKIKVLKLTVQSICGVGVSVLCKVYCVLHTCGSCLAVPRVVGLSHVAVWLSVEDEEEFWGNLQFLWWPPCFMGAPSKINQFFGLASFATNITAVVFGNILVLIALFYIIVPVCAKLFSDPVIITFLFFLFPVVLHNSIYFSPITLFCVCWGERQHCWSAWVTWLSCYTFPD